jgi:peroxiredoxin
LSSEAETLDSSHPAKDSALPQAAPAPPGATPRERRLLLLFAAVPLVFLLILAGYAWLGRVSAPPAPKSTPLRAGDKAPAFTFSDLRGRTVSPEDFRGRIVFLNIWATWCVTCTWEMPSMEALHRRYRDKGLAMVAVSIDALGKNVVVPYMKKLGLTFGYLLDPRGTVKGLYRITGVPETFIIDRQGKIIRKIIGPRQWMNPEMRNLIEIALRSS